MCSLLFLTGPCYGALALPTALQDHIDDILSKKVMKIDILSADNSRQNGPTGRLNGQYYSIILSFVKPFFAKRKNRIAKSRKV